MIIVGAVGGRFDPTLAAEHLEFEDGLKIDAETCGAGCWRSDCGRQEKNQKGDTSNEVTKRTYLTSFDTFVLSFVLSFCR